MKNEKYFGRKRVPEGSHSDVYTPQRIALVESDPVMGITSLCEPSGTRL